MAQGAWTMTTQRWEWLFRFYETSSVDIDCVLCDSTPAIADRTPTSIRAQSHFLFLSDKLLKFNKMSW